MKRTPLKRGTKQMKRSGFKRPTFEEAKAKAMTPRTNKPDGEVHLHRKKKVAKGKPKHPTICGIKSSKRWVGPMGTLWTIISMYVRKRDFIKYGKCVSCPFVAETWRDFQCGHFISVTRGNNATLLHMDNLHAQCPACNNPDMTPDASIPFADEIERRCGEGTVDSLWALLNVSQQAMSEIEIYREIARYKKLFDDLDGV